MSEYEQILKMRLEILGDITDDSKDDIFTLKLNDAECIALDTLYPFNNEIQELPNLKRLKLWQARCAIELYNAMERYGVLSYSENGLSVSYLTSLVSKELIDELVPKAGVPK